MNSDAIIAIWIGIIGASLGSFLNVVIDRPMHHRSLSGRSSCDYCGHRLRWYELIPIISFFILRGRCSSCYKTLSWQYPLVEAFSSLIAVTSIFYFPLYPLFMLIQYALLAIVVIDYKYGIIPDWTVILLWFAGLLLQVHSLPLALASSAVGVCLILLIYVLSQGTAMGFGDVRLAAAMGALLPLPYLLIALYIAVISGGLVAGYLLLTKRAKLKQTIAFGPFLALGTLAGLYYYYGQF